LANPPPRPLLAGKGLMAFETFKISFRLPQLRYLIGLSYRGTVTQAARETFDADQSPCGVGHGQVVGIE
jgi:hypothetical protein